MKKNEMISKVKDVTAKVIVPAMAATMYSVNTMTTTVFAAGPDAVTKPLNNLKTLVISVIGAVGVIILAKNVMEFAQAYQQQDQRWDEAAALPPLAGLP